MIFASHELDRAAEVAATSGDRDREDLQWVNWKRVAVCARLVAAKDLRLERRTKVATAQMLPFALLVLLLFAFALDPDRGVLGEATAGLYWTAVLFCGPGHPALAAIEMVDGVLDSVRLSGMPASAVFLGKVAGLVVQLAVLEVVLGVGVAVLYDARFEGWVLLGRGSGRHLRHLCRRCLLRPPGVPDPTSPGSPLCCHSCCCPCSHRC
ncbi:MAG: heme exporter protein CcmB [Microthrixaceae bacterium]